MTDIAPEHFRVAARPTPFHVRTSALNSVNHWERWKGYTVPASYDDVELEYFAIRNACGVFDLSPMNKYRVSGPQAQDYLNRLMTRDISKLRKNRVAYAVWCNDRGKVIDDGTLFHLAANEYRLCAGGYQLDWLCLSAFGFDVAIEDVTEDVAALAVQGPTSCAVLKALGVAGVETLKPFDVMPFSFKGARLMVSRTGFTGDLGYELWAPPELAVALWDALCAAGTAYGVRPIGTAALEMARIEAGFIQSGSDFMPALQTMRLDHDRSPFELGLGRLVDFSKSHFTGRRALMAEKERGARFCLVRLDIEGNRPAVESFVYARQGQKPVGHVTSALWSPSCKASIALASLETVRADTDRFWVEIYEQRELRWRRVWARARVVKGPFWNPARRQATPPPAF